MLRISTAGALFTDVSAMGLNQSQKLIDTHSIN
jgi:hypothetical protein